MPECDKCHNPMEMEVKGFIRTIRIYLCFHCGIVYNEYFQPIDEKTGKLLEPRQGPSKEVK